MNFKKDSLENWLKKELKDYYFQFSKTLTFILGKKKQNYKRRNRKKITKPLAISSFFIPLETKELGRIFG